MPARVRFTRREARHAPTNPRAARSRTIPQTAEAAAALTALPSDPPAAAPRLQAHCPPTPLRAPSRRAPRRSAARGGVALVLANGATDFDPTRLPVVSATYTLSEGDPKLFLDMNARTVVGSSNAELADSYVAQLQAHSFVEWFEPAVDLLQGTSVGALLRLTARSVASRTSTSGSACEPTRRCL